MKLFGKKETKNIVDLLDRHKNGSLNDVDFLREFGKCKVFYSTPFGDHKDGHPRLFLLPGHDKNGYLPVFSTLDKIKEFYELVGRVGYPIMETEFLDVLKTTKKINQSAPVKMGILIEPRYYDVTVDVENIDVVIGIIEGES